MVALTAKNSTEQRVLDYLNANASEVLTAKINSGKKTLAGALNHAKDEARKMAAGESCVCVDDATVFGWIIHYFEEDHIKEKARSTPQVPASVKPAKAQAPKAAAKTPAKKPAAKGPEQLSMFEQLMKG